MKTVHVTIEGRVQGVAYRAWTERTARALELSGWVRNRRDGTVEAVFCGEAKMVDRMVALCGEGPPVARVSAVRMLPPADDPPPPLFQVLATA